MKKIIKILSFSLLLLLIFIPINVKAEVNDVNLYLFYGRECPHCEDLIERLKDIQEDYPNLKVYKYEVWHNSSNVKLWQKVESKLNVPATGVPYTVIGNQVYTGYLAGDTDRKIISQIKYYQNHNLIDKVAPLLNLNKDKTKTIEKKPDTKSDFNLPVLGKIDAKKASLPLIAIVIGILDGFNPCAMWILLFLLSMLMGMKNKRRMWILGLSFIVTSAVIYLLFMLSWLKLTTFIGNLDLIKYLVSAFAIVGGYLNIKSYLKTKEDGCEVVDDKKRIKLMDRIRKFTREKSFILALLGIMALAVSVNFIELTCSAGFPVIFMQLLAINDVNIVQAIVYIGLYILFFLLDDIIVFAIAMKTMELKGFSTKYGKFSHLIGGILMLVIGILLILKSEWLMFNF